MKPTDRKRIAWIMLCLYLMLAPVPLWNSTDMMLCIEAACADCHDGIAFVPQVDHCNPADGACLKSSEFGSRISGSDPDECFCCVEIPISTYINENTPICRPHDPSGGIQQTILQALPGSYPVLSRASFSPPPDPHRVSSQKALRSVVLII